MNFQNVLEELDKLYEEDARKAAEEAKVAEEAEEAKDEKLTEAAEDEIPVDEEPAEEAVAEEPTEEAVVDGPKQLVIECAKCGAVFVKPEEEVVVDEATDLANVEEACAICEEAAGYKVLGELVSYASADETEETEEVPVEEEPEEDMAEALTEGKIIDNVKKVATRVGADAATLVRCFAELGDIITGRDSKFYDFAEYIENKAVLKALMSGNEKVMNTLTKEDIEELKDDVAAYEKAKADKKAGKTSDDEDLEELLDVKVDARGFGGTGNDVSVL